MKRAIVVGTSTVAGLAAVVAYQMAFLPTKQEPTNLALVDTTSSATGTTIDPAPKPAPVATTQPSATPSPSEVAQRTVTGDTVQTRFGPVQVEATFTGSKITDVNTLQAPNGDRRSTQISVQAIPQLEEQAVTNGDGTIDGVSGASYTSMGFFESLQSALSK